MITFHDFLSFKNKLHLLYQIIYQKAIKFTIHINILIDNLNKYDYYTNDKDTILSLKKLKNVKTNKDLSICLKELHGKNLMYQFLHQKSYINPETKDRYLDLNENLATLLIYLDKNQKQEIYKPINPVIKESISNLSYLMIVEKTLDINFIKNFILLTEKLIKNIAIDNLYYPLMFNENKKMFDVPDYYGRFSHKEGMIEITQVNNKFKKSTLTHELFHALDTYIFNHLKKEYPNLKNDTNEFTHFFYETEIYKSIPSIFEVNLDEIKNNKNYKSFFNFCDNFDKISESKKLSKENTKEYIEKYLDIKINECMCEKDFIEKVLDLFSKEKNKIDKKLKKIIPEYTEDIKLLSKQMFDYYNRDYADKSMYSLMSELISKLASEKDGYRCNLNEKCARVFEMNAFNNDEEIYKLLPENISEKNIYPVGNEREYYVNKLNDELRNMSNLLNQHIFIEEHLPKPKRRHDENTIPKGFSLPSEDDNKFDLQKMSKNNILSNIQKVRVLSNCTNESSQKIKL